jgi:hypothetical protein
MLNGKIHIDLRKHRIQNILHAKVDGMIMKYISDNWCNSVLKFTNIAIYSYS